MGKSGYNHREYHYAATNILHKIYSIYRHKFMNGNMSPRRRLDMIMCTQKVGCASQCKSPTHSKKYDMMD